MINQKFVADVAEKLYYMAFDCYNADFFLGDYEYSQSGQCYQAIDDIYRFYRAGLIFFPSQKSNSGVMEIRNVEVYLQLLLSNGSYVNDQEKYIHWIKYDICLTAFAKEIIERFGLTRERDIDLEAFGQFIEALFERHGVAWHDKALLQPFKRAHK